VIAILDCDGAQVGALDAEFAVMPDTEPSAMRQANAMNGASGRTGQL
jgi:hypothetical protein